MHTQEPAHPDPAPMRQPQLGSIALFLAWIEAWFTTGRAYWHATIAFEELYRLSASELEQHGYRRASLARDVTGFDVTQHADC